MSDSMDWLALQSLSDLARFANRPPEELGQVIVTSAMTEAAMEYIYSLYDPLMSTHLLEEVFRIMAVLQPRDLERSGLPALPSPNSRQQLS
jgi:hypothetical protein